MTQESEYFPGQQFNAVGVRDLAAQSQQPTTATPGRWSAEGGMIWAGGRTAYVGQCDGDVETARIAGKPTRHEYARLICAAVNAVREAIPVQTDAQRCEILESGDLAGSWRVYGDLLAGRQRDRAALAECREALAAIDTYPSSTTTTDGWTVAYHMMQIARALREKYPQDAQ